MKGDAPLRYAASAAISLYQRRLSPLKGFSCAHRVLNGGDSCSRHIKDLVLRLGPGATLTPARERLTACREANEAVVCRRCLADPTPRPSEASRESVAPVVSEGAGRRGRRPGRVPGGRSSGLRPGVRGLRLLRLRAVKPATGRGLSRRRGRVR